MKYKVGDRVRIRTDLLIGERYGGMTCNTSMYKLAKENSFSARVREAVGNLYMLDIDNEESPYLWSGEMLESSTKTLDDVSTLEVGDIVKEVDEDVDVGFSYRRVLAICGEAVLLSKPDGTLEGENLSRASVYWHTSLDFKTFGYELVKEGDIEVLKLTKEEIAEKFGVDKVEIVEED